MRTPTLIAICILPTCFCRADALDDSIRKEMTREHLPALTFAVVKQGHIIRLGAYGYGSLEWNAKATKNTRFEIASMSKMFTGAAIRILIEQKKLDPEDYISKYFDGLPDSWKSMRVRHLIDMDMGLTDDWGTDVIPYSADVTTPFDDASMLKTYYATKPVAPLGTEYHYASQGYSMLGMIVEKLSGESLSKFVDEHCFHPAGMSHSSYINNWAVVPERAQGYRHQDGVTVRGWYLGQYLHQRPDVGIMSTAEDMAKWVIALEQGNIVKDPSALWAGSSSDTGKWLDYSYGWVIETHLGHHQIDHSGGFRTGFHTFVARYPDDDVDVITLTNTDDSEIRHFNAMIASHYIPTLPDVDVLAMQKDVDPDETAISIACLKSLASGKVDESLMTPDAIDPLSISDVADFLKDMKTYRFSGRNKLKRPMIFHGHRLVSFTCILTSSARADYITTLYHDESGKIALVEATT